MKDKALELVFSTKFLILIVVTIFLLVGKVSESTWMETVLIVAGLRTASQVLDKHTAMKGKLGNKK
jgi:hypothetical protein